MLLIGPLSLACSFQPAQSGQEVCTSFYEVSADFTAMRYSPSMADVATSDGFWNRYRPMPLRPNLWNNSDLPGGDFSELVIGFDNVEPSHCSELTDLVAGSKGRLVETIAMHGKASAIVAKIPLDAMSAFAFKARLSKWVRYIEPNLEFKADFIPNDPYWSIQWGPAKIQADVAWNITTGSASILVAVVDTGIDWNHPDLAPNYVQLGYDWVNNDPAPMDDNGHGTHVAGTIAAAINNSIGIAGLANVRIMAEKVLDQNGTGWLSDVVLGIIHAVDSGAKIINLSLGGPVNSEILHEAVKYAFDQGVLVVAAGGNDATNVKQYPAGYDEVVAVTATNARDTLASFSNYGEWIDIAAPGVRIYSTVLDGSYAYKSGTSMASPHVVGVAALIWTRFPNMTRDQVWAQLQYTAGDLGDPGFDMYFGFGRLNARKAVEQAPLDNDLLVLRMEAPQRASPGMEATINATILNMGNLESNTTVELLVNNTLAHSFSIGFLASGASKTLSVPWNASAEGIYNVTAYVLPAQGETSLENNAFSRQITVSSPRFLKVPNDYGTIQSALDAANEGDIIHVASGTYNENIQITTKGLTLIGENRNNTFINGSGKTNVVTVVADHVKIDSFTIENSGQDNVGVWLISSNANTINNTVVLNNTYGIFLDHSPNTTLRNNIIVNNTYNFGSDGEYVEDFVHDIDSSNTVNGRPIYYLVDQHDLSVPTDAGFIAVVNSTNINVKDMSLTGNFEGILFVHAVDSSIENVNASSNGVGIYFYESMNNRINGSSLMNNEEAINLVGSSNNTVSFSKLCDNSFGLDIVNSRDNVANDVEAINNTYGVYLETSGHNSLRGNNMTGNRFNFGVAGTRLDDLTNDVDTSNTVDGKPVYYWVDQFDKQVPRDAGYLAAVNCVNITAAQLNISRNAQGILFAYVIESTITGNNLAENDRDNVALYYSNDNTISANNFSGASIGLEIDGSNNNIVYHNNLVGNAEQVLSCNSTSIWDNGYPSGGNYWSDYNRTDLFTGPYQNVTGSDSIGDTPLIIGANNMDNYPLVEPYPCIHAIAVEGVGASKTVIGQGFATNLGIGVVNRGHFEETLKVTVDAYVNANPKLATWYYAVTLTAGGSSTATFVWNTSGFVDGNYTLTASVEPVPNETDTADNICGSWVVVTIPGDVKGDFTVDIYDALLLSGAFNSKPISPNWNLNADINGDNIVDIYDAIILAGNYGKTT